MSVKLEAGKFYVTRDGCKVGPLHHRGSDWLYEFRGLVSDDSDRAGLWTESGEHSYGKISDYDIVQEWVEPPTTPAPQLDIKADLANEAVKIVTGARRGAYGTPENNFERIARFWTAYMLNTGRDIEITAMDVSPMMRLMKEARLCETPEHRDSHVDLIGYTLTGAEVNNVKPAVDNAS